MQPRKTWFLRKPDGSEYGPVSLDDLLRWSAQCRLVAGNAVSSDREEWVPVETLPELKMDWMAKRTDGKEYGPFALDAARELFDHQVLPPDAVLVNRRTGEQRPLTGVLEDRSPAADPDGGEADVPGSGDLPADDLPPDTAEGGAGGDRSVTGEPGALPSGETGTRQNETGTRQNENGAGPGTGDDADPTPRRMPRSRRRGGQENAGVQDDGQDAREGGDGSATVQADGLDASARQRKAEAEAFAQEAEALRSQIRSLQSALDQEQRQARGYTARISELEKERDRGMDAVRRLDERLKAAEDARRQADLQSHGELGDLRKQAAFMKKNMVILNAELDVARRQLQTRSRVILVLTAILSLWMLILLLRWGGGCGRKSRNESSVRPAEHADAAIPGDMPSGTVAAPPPFALPPLDIPGIRVRQEQDEWVVWFEEGVFSRMTTLTPSAERQLRSLASRVRSQKASPRIQVEGHTDDVPIRSSATFSGNEALATARAERVADFLRKEGRLPATSVKVSDRPGPPPYPNDSEVNRRRNRTVVLRLKAGAGRE